jgi:arylsulfatase A-like enzyme
MTPLTGDPADYSSQTIPVVVPLIASSPAPPAANSQSSSNTECLPTRVEASAASKANVNSLGVFQQAIDHSFPNRWIAALLVLAILIETSLLSGVSQPVFSNGWAMAGLSLMYLAWFWFTALLVLNQLSSKYLAWHHRTAKATRTATLVGLSVAGALTALLYAISWGIFLQTNRFANWEVISFALANQRDLWLYVTQAEPAHLLPALGIVVGACLAIPLGLKHFAHSRTASSAQPFYRNRLWVWLSIGMVLCGIRVVQDQSHRRRTENLAHLTNSLNPALTFTTSILESTLSEPIRPVLNEQQLVPLATRWNPVPTTGPQPSIIVVAIESFRSDVVHQMHQGREITPNINRLAREGLEWTNAYSQSTHSDYADICIVSSLYPLRTRQHHYYTVNDPWPKTLIYDTLKPAGYSTAIISSQNEMWGGMEHFLNTPHLDYFYHPQRSTETHLGILPERDLGFAHEVYTGHLKIGKFPDRHTADKALEWVEHQAKESKPFFISMNLQSSHFPFAMPDDVPRPFQPCELDSDVMFMIYPENRTPKVRNAYFNALHEADRQVGRLVEKLKELELQDKVILLVIGENGEAFHENNTVGHGREPYEPAIHVATIMWGPSYFQPQTEDYPLEHIDLIPTVYGRLGWEPHPNFQGIDALSPDRPPLDERLLFFHTRSPSSFCDAVQLAGRWKYMWSFDYNKGVLYDLKTDPIESIDYSTKYPELSQQLHDVLMEWRAKQLAYYHFPSYYQTYYPPPPPTWSLPNVTVPE